MAPYVAARRLVNHWLERLAVRDRVIARLEQDSELPGPVKELALACARQLKDDPGRLNEVSWSVVSRPGKDKEAYALALAQAETARRLAPDDGNILNTLGVAQYRAGKFEAALATLTKSAELNPRGADEPADRAFIAMAHYQLGHHPEARKELDRLRKSRAKPEEWGAEGLGFVGEAEELIEGKKVGRQTSP